MPAAEKSKAALADYYVKRPGIEWKMVCIALYEADPPRKCGLLSQCVRARNIIGREIDPDYATSKMRGEYSRALTTTTSRIQHASVAPDLSVAD